MRLLGSFALSLENGPVTLGLGAQHLVAYLALQRTPVPRGVLAAALWPERDERRAGGNLRSTLWRLSRQCPDLLDRGDGRLALSPLVTVDVDDMLVRVRRIGDRDRPLTHGDNDPAAFRVDLLAEWYEDWVLLERERLRQIRIHALETLCERLAGLGRFGEAIEAGLAAVAAEPLRESAHLAVMRCHRAEGNHAEVCRHYRSLRDLLRSELGVSPNRAVEDFMATVTRR